MTQQLVKNGYIESARGNLFRLAHPDPGGNVTPGSAAFDAAQPALIIRNRSDQASRISLRDLFARNQAAAANIVEVITILDAVDRYVTGGTARTPFQPNVDPNLDPPAPGITEAFENPTVTASGSPARGTIQAVAGSQLVDTETFTLDDGVNPPDVFEFDSGGGITGDVAVAFTGGDDAATVAASIIAAINGVGATLLIVARLAPGSTTLIDLTNEAGGVVGNVTITETVADPAFVVTGMAGGAVSTPLVVHEDSLPAGNGESKIMDFDEALIIGSPGTVLIYFVDSAVTVAPPTGYGLNFVKR